MRLHPSYLSAVLLLSLASLAHATPSSEDKQLTLSAFFKPINQDKKRLGQSLGYTFNSTVATDSINTLRLCSAGADTTCSSCNTAFTLITAGTPFSYPRSPATQTYGISPASVAAYLAGQSFGNGSYNIGMYVQLEFSHF